MNSKTLQNALKAAGYYRGAVGGILGPKSMAAIGGFLGDHLVGYRRWGKDRQIIAAKQLVTRQAGIEVGVVDGLIGPQTRYAFEVYNSRLIGDKTPETWRDNEPESPPSPVWPKQANAAQFFGPAGSPACTAGKVDLPFPFRIAWNKTQKVGKFSCHEKVSSSLTSIFRQSVAHYGEAAMKHLGLDLFGGCYNYRLMRGGSSLSTHAYGIAVDLDPERNQLKWGKDRAQFARPVYEPFWAIVEAQGAVSLGRARNYDWMHFQFATL